MSAYKYIAGSFFAICVFCISSSTLAQEGMSREQVIQALEKGIVALQTIDRTEDAERLTQVLHQYLDGRKRRERKSEFTERDIALQRLEIMSHALEGLQAAEKERAADTLRKAIRALEMRLEGIDNAEAREFIARSPDRGAQIELLMYASRFLREQGKTEKANVVAELAEKIRANWERKKSGQREQPGEREIGQQHIEHMMIALEGLIAAEKMEAAESLEKAIRARRLRLEGAKSEEARRMIADSPNRGQQVELLMYASNLLKEQGKHDRAEVVAKLADTLHRPKRNLQQKQADADANRRERLQNDLEVLAQEMERAFAELQVKREQIFKQIAETGEFMAKKQAEFDAMTDEHRQRMHHSMEVINELNARIREIDDHHIERLQKMNQHLRSLMERELSDQ